MRHFQHAYETDGAPWAPQLSLGFITDVGGWLVVKKDEAITLEKQAEAFGELQDPRLRALATRLRKVAPWPPDSEWMSQTKARRLAELDTISSQTTEQGRS